MKSSYIIIFHKHAQRPKPKMELNSKHIDNVDNKNKSKHFVICFVIVLNHETGVCGPG